MSATQMALAKAVRRRVLEMTHASRASHVGSCLSVADILAVLYSGILQVDPKKPEDPGRDRLIVSKGHAAAAVYAVLAEIEFFPTDTLAGYCCEGSFLLGHVSHDVPGVEFSTGSLGHGLPVATGMSMAAARRGETWRSFVVLSDGELDEGSNWEAILFAAHHRLVNLIAIVDYNKIQSFGRIDEVLGLEPMAEKWESFGWAVRQIDGHDCEALNTALTDVPFETGQPSVVIADTVKGKGVPFMEDDLTWHYKSPDDAELQAALEALEASA
jgi:transketolase